MRLGGRGMDDAQWLRERAEDLVRYEEDAQRLRRIAARLTELELRLSGRGFNHRIKNRN